MKTHNIFLSLCAAVPIWAAACGVCIEDKMAATYDHAVITSAFHHGHAVVFAEMLDAPSYAKGQERKIIQAIEATPGVDRGSVRVSLNPAAISFAFDDRKVEAQNVFDTATSSLKSGVRFTLIRTIKRP
jgi:hypothetical protein